jgi:hypothetical protein
MINSAHSRAAHGPCTIDPPDSRSVRGGERREQVARDPGLLAIGLEHGDKATVLARRGDRAAIQDPGLAGDELDLGATRQLIARRGPAIEIGRRRSG